MKEKVKNTEKTQKELVEGILAGDLQGDNEKPSIEEEFKNAMQQINAGRQQGRQLEEKAKSLFVAAYKDICLQFGFKLEPVAKLHNGLIVADVIITPLS